LSIIFPSLIECAGRSNDLLTTLRALKPQENKIRVLSYLEVQAGAGFLSAPVAHFQTDLFLSELNADAIATITKATNGAPPNTKVLLVPLYEAVLRVGPSDTAFPLRQRGARLRVGHSGALERARGKGGSRGMGQSTAR
jgi:hypothetical protein